MVMARSNLCMGKGVAGELIFGKSVFWGNSVSRSTRFS
jgi:hypothetical protein